MCGRFELKTKFDDLPKIMKKNYPTNLNNKYQTQDLIKPNDPVLVLKNEGKIITTFMYWGFISPWSSQPFNKSIARPFNARSETIKEKIMFKNSWKYKRCLIPASGFFEKGFLIRKKNYKTFWLGGIWSKWTSADGAELDSCCILTTTPNELIKPLHNRMPVVIAEGYEEQWTQQVKENNDLKDLFKMLRGWSSKEWIAEEINQSTIQMNLF